MKKSDEVTITDYRTSYHRFATHKLKFNRFQKERLNTLNAQRSSTVLFLCAFFCTWIFVVYEQEVQFNASKKIKDKTGRNRSSK